MNMKEKSIIIIGGGIAGLSAGCYGQMNEYKTRIFEMHTLPGCKLFQLFNELPSTVSVGNVNNRFKCFIPFSGVRIYDDPQIIYKKLYLPP